MQIIPKAENRAECIEKAIKSREANALVRYDENMRVVTVTNLASTKLEELNRLIRMPCYSDQHLVTYPLAEEKVMGVFTIQLMDAICVRICERDFYWDPEEGIAFRSLKAKVETPGSSVNKVAMDEIKN